MKAGRPTKFNPEVLLKVRILYGQGKTDEQVADIVGVAVRTLHDWKHRYAEFLHSLKEAKDEADDLVEATLYQRAIGYTHRETKVFCTKDGDIVWKEIDRHVPPDVTAAIFWLKNRRPEKWREKPSGFDDAIEVGKREILKVRTFAEFCEIAGYPKVLEQQLVMHRFIFEETDPRMLLGARGYGKTDYCTILGCAYDVFLNGVEATNLIITKSKSRNTAIMGEIANALRLNGVALEKENSSCVRISGLVGKDHSVEAITIKTSMRGRHPKRIIMDDPVTEEDVSEAMRLTVKRKYNEAMKLCANVGVIGQPAHKHDLYAELRPMVKTLEMPFGTIPELDHDLEAQRLAGVDESSIQASYFLKVVSDENSPFEKVQFTDIYPVGDSVAFIDPSFEGGDFTAMTILRMVGDTVRVVGFVWKKAWNHCIDDMVSKMKRFGVRRLCFETNSLGDMPIDILNSAVGESIGVIGKKSNGNKHSRILAAGTYAPAIHISKESDRIYIDQVVKYEYDAKNDDAPDSLASALEWVGLVRGKLNERN